MSLILPLNPIFTKPNDINTANLVLAGPRNGRRYTSNRLSLLVAVSVAVALAACSGGASSSRQSAHLPTNQGSGSQQPAANEASAYPDAVHSETERKASLEAYTQAVNSPASVEESALNAEAFFATGLEIGNKAINGETLDPKLVQDAVQALAHVNLASLSAQIYSVSASTRSKSQNQPNLGSLATAQALQDYATRQSTSAYYRLGDSVLAAKSQLQTEAHALKLTLAPKLQLVAPAVTSVRATRDVSSDSPSSAASGSSSSGSSSTSVAVATGLTSSAYVNALQAAGGSALNSYLGYVAYSPRQILALVRSQPKLKPLSAKALEGEPNYSLYARHATWMVGLGPVLAKAYVQTTRSQANAWSPLLSTAANVGLNSAATYQYQAQQAGDLPRSAITVGVIDTSFITHAQKTDGSALDAWVHQYKNSLPGSTERHGHSVATTIGGPVQYGGVAPGVQLVLSDNANEIYDDPVGHKFRVEDFYQRYHPDVINHSYGFSQWLGHELTTKQVNNLLTSDPVANADIIAKNQARYLATMRELSSHADAPLNVLAAGNKSSVGLISSQSNYQYFALTHMLGWWACDSGTVSLTRSGADLVAKVGRYKVLCPTPAHVPTAGDVVNGKELTQTDINRDYSALISQRWGVSRGVGASVDYANFWSGVNYGSQVRADLVSREAGGSYAQTSGNEYTQLDQLRYSAQAAQKARVANSSLIAYMLEAERRRQALHTPERTDPTSSPSSQNPQRLNPLIPLRAYNPARAFLDENFGLGIGERWFEGVMVRDAQVAKNLIVVTGAIYDPVFKVDLLGNYNKTTSATTDNASTVAPPTAANSPTTATSTSAANPPASPNFANTGKSFTDSAGNQVNDSNRFREVTFWRDLVIGSLKRAIINAAWAGDPVSSQSGTAEASAQALSTEELDKLFHLSPSLTIDGQKHTDAHLKLLNRDIHNVLALDPAMLEHALSGNPISSDLGSELGDSKTPLEITKAITTIGELPTATTAASRSTQTVAETVRSSDSAAKQAAPATEQANAYLEELVGALNQVLGFSNQAPESSTDLDQANLTSVTSGTQASVTSDTQASVTAKVSRAVTATSLSPAQAWANLGKLLLDKRNGLSAQDRQLVQQVVQAGATVTAEAASADALAAAATPAVSRSTSYSSLSLTSSGSGLDDLRTSHGVGDLDDNGYLDGFEKLELFKRSFASDILSMQCGVAMYHCLTAPMHTTTYVKGRNSNSSLDTYTHIGTSFAAPYVSGIAALVKQQFSFMTNTQLKQTLFTTAIDLGAPGVDSVFGWGMVNAAGALNGPAWFWDEFDAQLNRISPQYRADAPATEIQKLAAQEASVSGSTAANPVNSSPAGATTATTNSATASSASTKPASGNFAGFYGDADSKSTPFQPANTQVAQEQEQQRQAWQSAANLRAFHFNNAIGGVGGLRVSGSPRNHLYLTNHNSYTGKTTVDSGRLIIIPLERYVGAVGTSRFTASSPTSGTISGTTAPTAVAKLAATKVDPRWSDPYFVSKSLTSYQQSHYEPKPDSTSSDPSRLVGARGTNLGVPSPYLLALTSGASKVTKTTATPTSPLTGSASTAESNYLLQAQAQLVHVSQGYDYAAAQASGFVRNSALAGAGINSPLFVAKQGRVDLIEAYVGNNVGVEGILYVQNRATINGVVSFNRDYAYLPSKLVVREATATNPTVSIALQPATYQGKAVASLPKQDWSGFSRLEAKDYYVPSQEVLPANSLFIARESNQTLMPLYNAAAATLPRGANTSPVSDAKASVLAELPVLYARDLGQLPQNLFIYDGLRDPAKASRFSLATITDRVVRGQNQVGYFQDLSPRNSLARTSLGVEAGTTWFNSSSKLKAAAQAGLGAQVSDKQALNTWLGAFHPYLGIDNLYLVATYEPFAKSASRVVEDWLTEGMAEEQASGANVAALARASAAQAEVSGLLTAEPPEATLAASPQINSGQTASVVPSASSRSLASTEASSSFFTPAAEPSAKAAITPATQPTTQPTIQSTTKPKTSPTGGLVTAVDARAVRLGALRFEWVVGALQEQVREAAAAQAGGNRAGQAKAAQATLSAIANLDDASLATLFYSQGGTLLANAEQANYQLLLGQVASLDLPKQGLTASYHKLEQSYTQAYSRIVGHQQANLAHLAYAWQNFQVGLGAGTASWQEELAHPASKAATNSAPKAAPNSAPKALTDAFAPPATNQPLGTVDSKYLSLEAALLLPLAPAPSLGAPKLTLATGVSLHYSDNSSQRYLAIAADSLVATNQQLGALATAKLFYGVESLAATRLSWQLALGADLGYFTTSGWQEQAYAGQAVYAFSSQANGQAATNASSGYFALREDGHALLAYHLSAGAKVGYELGQLALKASLQAHWANLAPASKPRQAQLAASTEASTLASRAQVKPAAVHQADLSQVGYSQASFSAPTWLQAQLEASYQLTPALSLHTQASLSWGRYSFQRKLAAGLTYKF